MKYILKTILLGLILSGMSSCYYDNKVEIKPNLGNTPIDTTKVMSYTKDVLPILTDNSCLSCHSSAAASGTIVLEGYTELTKDKIINLNTGLLLPSLKHRVEESKKMPQGGTKLSDAKIAVIESWIKNGYPNN